MKFANWTVTDVGIEWQGNDLQRFVVKRQDLLETKGNMYKWILMATEEDWLTDDDLYDFNFAFVYAAAARGNDFDYRLFDETVAEQYRLLDEEEDDEPL